MKKGRYLEIACSVILSIGCLSAIEIINRGDDAIFSMAQEYRKSKKGYKDREPFLSQRQLSLDLEGWFDANHQQHVKKLLQKVNPKIIVDIGVWKGLTTVFFGINSDSKTKIYAIDLFGTKPVSVPDNVFVAHSEIGRTFISNIKYFKIGDKVVPVPLDSLFAVKHLDIIPDFVYIDGDHSDDNVYKNIIAWSKRLSADGIVCGGAYNWAGGLVGRAVERAAQELGKRAHHDEGFWWIE